MNKTSFADHDLVDIMISYNPLSADKSAEPEFDDNSFRALHFNKANFVKIKKDLSEIGWDQLRDLCSFKFRRIAHPVHGRSFSRCRAIKCFAKKEKRIEARLIAALCCRQLIQA